MTPAHDFNRTVCACERCTACCKRQPGALIPGDLERIAAARGETVEEAKKNFWASGGSVVKMVLTGETKRIGSITPRFRKGRCVFLNEENRCSIHAVAPFGCAYFDTHMSNEQGMPRSLFLAEAMMDADYQAQRNTLPIANHYKPTRYT